MCLKDNREFTKKMSCKQAILDNMCPLHWVFLKSAKVRAKYARIRHLSDLVHNLFQRCPSCRENFNSTKPSRNLALENLFSNVLQLSSLSQSQPETCAGAGAGMGATSDPDIVVVSSPPQPILVPGSGSASSSGRYLPSAPSLEDLL